MKRVLMVMALCLFAFPGWGRDLSRQRYLIGERAAGMGGAFVSMVGDAASSYYNPAGLGGLYKQGLSLSASAYQLSLENYGKILDLDVGGGDRITADMGSFSFGTFPTSIIYVLPLGKQLEGAGFHQVLAFSVLVPDFDKFKAEIDKPIGDYAFELKGIFLNEDTTYWVGPSYAVSVNQSLRLGVSLFALAHVSESQSKLGLKTTADDGAGGWVNDYLTSTYDRSGLGLTMLVQAGVQYDISESLTLGLTVRSPTLATLYSQVSVLELNSAYAEDIDGNPLVTAEMPGYVDRIEAKEGLEMNYRLPMMLALGLSYRRPQSFTVALDLSLHLSQSTFLLFNGSKIYPSDPMGDEILDDERALDPIERRKKAMVFNANLGAEVYFTDTILGRIGLFTNFSAVDQDFYNQDTETRLQSITLPRVNAVGLSLGLGLLGEKTTTSFGLVYAMGQGDGFSLTEAFGEAVPRIDVTSHVITIVLSGSADL